jgi:predicted amidophosphoribosyltransferase
MVGNGREIVNLQECQRSTTSVDVAHWLRCRSPELSFGRRWTFFYMSARCVYCGGRGDLGAIDLCEACLTSLPWLPAGGNGDREARALFAYQSPIDEDLRALKFHGDLRPARVFGALCAARIALAEVAVDCIVPVPLHGQRLRERGFNQTSRLARELAAWLGVPLQEQWLQRSRSTAAQTSLPAVERRRNVQGAFALSTRGRGALARAAPTEPAVGSPASVPSRLSILLLDDVLTTGARLQAAGTAFGGAVDLHCWTVAMAMPAKIARPT